MKAVEHPCSFCGGALVAGYTEAEGGVVYISTRCTLCRERVDAAGVGEERAEADLAAKLRARQGTEPERWRIPIRPGSGTRSTTRRRFVR